MLAAAHVLAMDAKNLLDVVDCIRERHPHVDWRSALRDVSPEPGPPPLDNQTLSSQNQVFAPQCQTLTPQNPVLSTQSSLQEPIKPDFKVNQPVTAVTTAIHVDQHKEHNSLPVTSNRVSTLIHNFNFGNVKDQHIYGNETQFQHSQSCDDSKLDGAPYETARSKVQAATKDTPAIYSVSKKMLPLEHSDQG